MSHVSCTTCGSSPATLRCSACKTVTYCSSACQRGHWKAHKPVCRALAAVSMSDVVESSKRTETCSGTLTAPSVSAPKSLEAFLSVLGEHRARYSSLGKAEWWWLFEDTLDDVAACLRTHHMVWLDGFMLPHQTVDLRSEVVRVKEAGLLKNGVVGGGRLGSSLGYVHEKVRGDLMAWFNGDEPDCHWTALPQYGKKVGTIVSELAKCLPELSHTTLRSKYMMTCYPGQGTRYTRHCDNANGNGRRLTALLYLNPGWRPSDGGCLRVYAPDGVTQRFDVQPLCGRLVLFWSDKRVPHEVLPTHADRYCVTVWFFDKDERAKAEAEAAAEGAADEARVRKEMSEFEAELGGRARPVHAELQGIISQESGPAVEDAAPTVKTANVRDPSTSCLSDTASSLSGLKFTDSDTSTDSDDC